MPWRLIVRWVFFFSFGRLPHPFFAGFYGERCVARTTMYVIPNARVALVFFSCPPKSKRRRCLPHHPPHDARLSVQRLWSHDEESCVFEVCNAQGQVAAPSLPLARRQGTFGIDFATFYLQHALSSICSRHSFADARERQVFHMTQIPQARWCHGANTAAQCGHGVEADHPIHYNRGRCDS